MKFFKTKEQSHRTQIVHRELSEEIENKDAKSGHSIPLIPDKSEPLIPVQNEHSIPV